MAEGWISPTQSFKPPGGGCTRVKSIDSEWQSTGHLALGLISLFGKGRAAGRNMEADLEGGCFQLQDTNAEIYGQGAFDYRGELTRTADRPMGRPCRLPAGQIKEGTGEVSKWTEGGETRADKPPERGNAN